MFGMEGYARGVTLSVALAVSPAGLPAQTAVRVRLSEWKVELAQRAVAPGPVTFTAVNTGTIPHAFEVEGKGLEEETGTIAPGDSATLRVTLAEGRYRVYCPVGEDSHRKLGMVAELIVGLSPRSTTSPPGPLATSWRGGTGVRVTGGGPVIQILPGPFPFPDSAAPVLAQFGAEEEGLESQVKRGPYSNVVARISGTFAFTAWDFGATRDSVLGAAQIVTEDGARWRLSIDRVQTRDVPHHPRFGGVILGLYYHGSTGVHTPLVPTINSAVALWAVGHLYRNDSLVSDNAQVHVMLLSHTRRDGDFALECWDCSKNKVDELQLQVLPAPGDPGLPAPGGFLFVNWEKSRRR